MNIVHVITTISRGGAEKQLLILCREQIKMGHKVKVIPLKGAPELQSDFIESGIEVSLDVIHSRFIKQVYFLREKYRNSTAIIHAHLPRAELICRLINPLYFIITRHNSEPFFPKYPGLISKVLSRFVMNRVKSCIAISASVKTFLLKSREVKSENEIIVIHYGFDAALNPEIPNKKLNSNKDSSFRIGSIGRLVEQKNYETALKSLMILKNMGLDFEYTIIGKGPLEHKLKIMARTLGLASNINWIRSTSDVSSYLRDWDCFLFPSIYEGFGLVLLEALSFHLPIVATNISAMPEVLGLDYPLLCKLRDPEDFSNKLKLVASNSKEANTAIAKSDEILRNFTSEKMANDLNQVYLRILEDK